MPDQPIRKIRIFVSSPTDVMAERQRARLVVDRMQSRFRDRAEITAIFFEEADKYYTADKSFQEQIPDAGDADLVVSIFWGRLGSELAAETFGTMPDGRPYPGGAVYELTRAIEARRKRNLPDILVYRKVAATGISVTDPAQRRLMMAQLDALETFWEQWFVSREGHFRAGFQTFQRPDEFEHRFEAHLRAWLNEQGLGGRELIWKIAERGSPFRGLEPYEPGHAEVFFGREREIDRGRERLLAAAMGGTAFLLVMGPSGVGKSSLVRAGLVTRLTQPGDIDGVDAVRFALMRPGQAATPQQALAQALFVPQALPELAQGDFQSPAELAAVLSGEADAAKIPILRALDRLADRLKTEQSRDRRVEARLLLVVDQLEELFAAKVSDAARAGFVRLMRALAGSGGVYVIATLRSSSYGALARESELVELKDSGAALDVPVPGPEVLTEVVRKPAAAAGLAFERRQQTSLDETLLEAAGGNVDALPLLGFTLQWLFDKRVGEELSYAAYEQLGGLEGAISRSAEQAFMSVSEAAQATLPRLLRGLAESARGTAALALRDHPLASLPEETPLRALADALVAARILLIRGEGEGAALRVTHEAVLRGWPRARDIVGKEQEFYRIRGEVVGAERRWRVKRRGDLLLPPGLPLAEAQSLRTTYGAELGGDVLAFIDASTRKERRRQRRGYLLATVFAIAAIAAVVATIYAGRLQQSAEQNLTQALLTQAHFLSEGANQNLGNGDAGTAMLLALEALPDGPGAGRPYAADAEATLFSARRRLQEMAILDGHKAAVQAAQFSPDGKQALTASLDMSARIWDIETGKPLVTLTGHLGDVLGATFSPDGKRIVTASTDQRGRIWDAATGQTIRVLDGHTDSILGAEFSPDGKSVITASEDRTARIWDEETGQTKAVLIGHSGFVTRARFSPDGAHVVTASSDKTARIWDVATGQATMTLAGHAANVNGAAFSPDGLRVVTASSDASARIWNVETGQSIGELKGHTAGLLSADFSHDGRFIVTASADGTARIWNADSGQSIATLNADSGSMLSAQFSGDDQRLITASSDATARIWRVMPDDLTTVLAGHTAEVYGAALSPDGRRVVTGSGDNTARLWDAETGKSIATLSGHSYWLWSVAFSPDGRSVATGSADGTARIWDAETGRFILALVGHGADVNSVAFSSDGHRIVTASSDNSVRIWNADSGQAISVLGGDTHAMLSAAFSPDGRRVVTASDDPLARVKVRDADTGATMAVINTHKNRVLSVVFSPDGKAVLSASWDGTAIISDAATGAAIVTLRGHRAGIPTAAFSPDGRRVVTGSYDSTARIWDAQSGETITTLEGHASWIWSASFSADNRRVLTGSADRTGRIWHLFPTTQDLVDDAKRMLPRCLTRAERERYFLDRAPPTWCVETSRWPYNTGPWRSWLAQRKAGRSTPFPD
jgi:WD40 repeat protein